MLMVRTTRGLVPIEQHSAALFLERRNAVYRKDQRALIEE
jgi:hypothetical protein